MKTKATIQDRTEELLSQLIQAIKDGDLNHKPTVLVAHVSRTAKWLQNALESLRLGRLPKKRLSKAQQDDVNPCSVCGHDHDEHDRYGRCEAKGCDCKYWEA